MSIETTVPDSVTSEKSKRKGLSFLKTLLYALGSGAGVFLYNTFGSFIQFFYADIIGLPVQWVGRGLFAFGFWNALNDPIVGWIADSKKSATGRRSWFIRTMAIPVGIAFLAVWLPPFNVAQHGALTVMAYFLIIISVYDVIQSLITLNVDALLPEMFQETTARLNGAVVVTVIGSIFGGLGVLLAPLVYNNFGWAALAVVWGVVAASLYLISLQGIRENPKYAEAEDAPILERLGVVLRNRTFLIVVGLNLCFRMILAVLTASLPFYTKYALNDERAITVLVGVFLAAYTVGMIAWQPVFKRFGTRNTLLISMLVFAAASLLTLITSTVTGTMLAVALIGFGLQGPMLVGAQLLFGDTVDEDYAKTGIRREGLYRGMLGFVYRWPPAFSALLLSEFLARSGYDATVPPAMQPPLVGNSIRYFIAFAPMISALIGAALAYIYPLHGERFKQIQADVQRRNAELEEVSTHQNP